MARWIEHDPTMYHHLPNKPACYAVQFDGRTVYVGQTTMLRTRFNRRFRPGYSNRTTFTPWGPVTARVTMKYRPALRYGDWAMRELRLIRRLQPEYNRQHVTMEG